jgi:hypothetical protein
MKTVGLAGLLLLGLGAAACGGSSGGVSDGGIAGRGGAGGGSAGAGGVGSQGACGTVQPCGGAIVGTWKASAACILDASLFGADDIKQTCATAKLEASSFSITGTSTFKTDKTYANVGTFTLGLKLTLPLTCFGVGKDCAGLQAVYEQQGVFVNPTCSVMANACVCSLVTTEDTGDSGTYATSGTTVTTTGTDGTPSDDAYCVAGNELHSIDIDMTMPMGPMGMAKIRADLVFTKQ